MSPAECNLKAEPISFECWRRFLEQAVISKSMQNVRRKHKRYDVEGELKVRFVQCRKEYTRTWSLLQLSYGGVTAKANNEVPIDLTVEMGINVGGHLLGARGSVSHCTETLGGYKVGIQLEFQEDA